MSRAGSRRMEAKHVSVERSRKNSPVQNRYYSGYDYYDKPSKFLVERNDPGADSRIIYLRHPTTGTEVWRTIILY